MSTIIPRLFSTNVSSYSSIAGQFKLKQNHPMAISHGARIVEFNCWGGNNGANMGILVSCTTAELDMKLHSSASSSLPSHPIKLWINWAGYTRRGYDILPGSLGHLAKEVALCFQDFISRAEYDNFNAGHDGASYPPGNNNIVLTRLTLLSIQNQYGVDWVADVLVDVQ